MLPVALTLLTLRYLCVLAIGQIIGWGTVGLLTVLGSDIATALGQPLPLAFAGGSVFYVSMGLAAPLLARAFVRFGARMLLTVGAGTSAVGFVLLATSQTILTYYAAWIVLGAAGAASLSTAAYIALNDALGGKAGRAIGLLMIVSGLSSTIFWPIAAYLGHAIGWRLTCAVFALIILLVSPLYFFGLPKPHTAGPEPSEQTPPAARASGSTFYFIAASISLNAFVTFGFSGIVIELFKSLGVTGPTATGLASSIGVVSICARALDIFGGRRWDGLYTALVSAPILLASLLLLLCVPAPLSWQLAQLFVLVYGFGSGAFAVARATMPMVFFQKAAYTQAASHIALPLNLLSAAAPPTLVALLGHFGPSAVLMLSALCSAAAFGIVLLLHRRRPA